MQQSRRFRETQAVARVFGRRMVFIAGEELYVAERPGHAPEPQPTPQRPARQGRHRGRSSARP